MKLLYWEMQTTTIILTSPAKSKPALKGGLCGETFYGLRTARISRGDGAVLQNEAGDADAAVFPDVGVGRAVLPQGQIGLQVGQAGGEIFEVDLRTRFAEPVQGIQGIGAEMAADRQ